MKTVTLPLLFLPLLLCSCVSSSVNVDISREGRLPSGRRNLCFQFYPGSNEPLSPEKRLIVNKLAELNCTHTTIKPPDLYVILQNSIHIAGQRTHNVATPYGNHWGLRFYGERVQDIHGYWTSHSEIGELSNRDSNDSAPSYYTTSYGNSEITYNIIDYQLHLYIIPVKVFSALESSPAPLYAFKASFQCQDSYLSYISSYLLRHHTFSLSGKTGNHSIRVRLPGEKDGPDLMPLRAEGSSQWTLKEATIQGISQPPVSEEKTSSP